MFGRNNYEYFANTHINDLRQIYVYTQKSLSMRWRKNCRIQFDIVIDCGVNNITYHSEWETKSMWEDDASTIVVSTQELLWCLVNIK